MITVSIVEDNELTRESLAELLNLATDLTVKQAYVAAEDALALVPQNPPDVLLVDINLPGKSGIECVAELKALLPSMQVLMLTTYDNTDAIFNSLRAGASGYLLKRSQASELIAAIKEVHTGGSPMSASIARKVVQHFQGAYGNNVVPSPKAEIQGLTAREMEILSELAQGLHYKEIGDKLGISTGTVRVHLHKIYGKLHVQSRTEAVVKFLGR